MDNKILVYRKLKREQKYWLMVIGVIMLAIVIAFLLLTMTNGKFTFLGVILFLLTFVVEVYTIIKLSKCSKALNDTGMEIATQLAPSYKTQKELKNKLIEIGIARNFATSYSIRILGDKRTFVTPQKNVVSDAKPLEIKCPQCHTDKVHWVPYEKTSFGSTFYIWLVLSLLGYSFSPLVTIVMLILFVLTLIVRIIENRVSKKINCYQCDMCGHKFEISKQ